MKMSDKDFDQLFNTKLGDMEIEPSANVWNNITNELDGKQHNKKGGLSFMQIAAGIIMLMAAGLYFLRPVTHKIELHPMVLTQPVNGQSNTATNIIPLKNNKGYNVVQPVQTTARVKYQPYRAKVKPEDGQLVTERATTTPLLADVVNDQSAVGGADIHPNTLQAQTKLTQPVTASSDDATQIKQPGILAQNLTEFKEPAKKKRIHTLGDLLNVVIAKVDKRDNKIAEFTNNADDDSFSITGINLGLIRAKKEK